MRPSSHKHLTKNMSINEEYIQCLLTNPLKGHGASVRTIVMVLISLRTDRKYLWLVGVLAEGIAEEVADRFLNVEIRITDIPSNAFDKLISWVQSNAHCLQGGDYSVLLSSIAIVRAFRTLPL